MDATLRLLFPGDPREFIREANLNLRYSFLTRDHYPELFKAFVEAFSDYAVDMSYMKEADLLNRWIKNRVDFESSVGAFDGEKLVGFTVVGIDDWAGEPAAFDAGTGVIRGFRGFGVAPAMFEMILRRLDEKGIGKFVLEVLQENKPAVRTYKKAGFKVTREFDCFRLNLPKTRPAAPPSSDGLIIEPVPKKLLPLFQSFADWPPSWECGFSAIDRIPDDVFLYGARRGDEWVGFIAYYPGLNWIMNNVVKPSCRRQGIATRLLARAVQNLPDQVAFVKAINIDHTDQATLTWMNKMGFEVYTRQYEMALDVRDGLNIFARL